MILRFSKALFALAVCITLLPVYCEHRRERSTPWYYTLPNDRLDGVPKNILDNEKNYLLVKDFALNVVGRSGHSERIQKAAAKLQVVPGTNFETEEKMQKMINDSVPFPCDIKNARSAQRPTSVHALRPGDIDVIAAMGDSLTAGNGAFALNIQHLTVENRGVCAMIGGQGNWRKFLTVPNILKEFNPKLFGYALGDSFTHHRESQFDIAEIGAMSQDIPYMTRQLVNRIKKDKRVNFKNDWKLVTLLIGPNNFCIDLCYLEDPFTSVKTHRENLLNSFEYIRDNMPRTIINLIMVPNLHVIVNFKGVPSKCVFLHLYECPCLFALQHKRKLETYIRIMEAWQRVEEEIANDERFRTKEDFTVVVQPFTKNITFPLKRNSHNGEIGTDFSFLSDDCFHFSQKGYATAANALWNNMLEPIGAKSINWDSTLRKFLCPSERSPFIYTWKNSRQ